MRQWRWDAVVPGQPRKQTQSRTPGWMPRGLLGHGEHGANVTNMVMKCASDKSNILTNLYEDPQNQPAASSQQRDQTKFLCVFKYMLMTVVGTGTGAGNGMRGGAQ